MTTLEIDWHWIAGIWEGEGCVCITTQAQRRPFKKGIRLIGTIAQKDIEMLRYIRELTQMGSIQKGNRCFQWIVASRSAREFFTQLLPYVRTQRRRSQVTAALKADADARTKAKQSLIAANRRRSKS